MPQRRNAVYTTQKAEYNCFKREERKKKNEGLRHNTES